MNRRNGLLAAVSSALLLSSGFAIRAQEAAVPLTEAQIAQLQANDPRCAQ